jgi:hypothetical protein
MGRRVPTGVDWCPPDLPESRFPVFHIVKKKMKNRSQRKIKKAELWKKISAIGNA